MNLNRVLRFNSDSDMFLETDLVSRGECAGDLREVSDFSETSIVNAVNLLSSILGSVDIIR